MTCSSNMISTPDAGRRDRGASRALLALGAALAGAMLAPAVPGSAASSGKAADLIAGARAYLARGDGIAAEIRLNQALDEGALREDVAAFMGEALLDQNEPGKARSWLAPGQFTPQTAAWGFRMLARLERTEGDLPAASRAFDRAVGLTPRDPELWVEIGRLRYAGGEHLRALQTADYALKLDRSNVRALEFHAQIVRDRYGLAASLPWFKAALNKAPDDLSVLGEYAATLGDMGWAKEMLAVTRKMIALDPDNARAFYLQAVMAARAGNTRLARSLLSRGGEELNDVPGAMLLLGVLEIRAGNPVLAADALEPLVKRQPDNATAQVLLARALFLSGDYKELVRRYADLAGRPGASPYLLTLMGRAYEMLDQRDLAAPLLDRAAMASGTAISVVPESSPIAALLGAGDDRQAEAEAEQWRAASPGNYDSQAQAGDVQLAMGNGEAALQRYRLAARIRMPQNLMLRTVAAYMLAGHRADAERVAVEYLRNNPMDREAARLAAHFAAQRGDWPRARQLLENLRANGAARDVAVLSELSLAQLRTGDGQAAVQTGENAYRLQRASPTAAVAWGLGLAALGQDSGTSAALLTKAQRIMGNHPLIAEGQSRLGRPGAR